MESAIVIVIFNVIVLNSTIYLFNTFAKKIYIMTAFFNQIIVFEVSCYK